VTGSMHKGATYMPNVFSVFAKRKKYPVHKTEAGTNKAKT